MSQALYEAVHPAAELFPLLDEAELAELAADIKAHGLREPVWLWENGKRFLLDGRNRVAACKLAAVVPATRFYKGSDPLQFVVSENMRRRHLNPGQRAAVAEALEPLYAEEAAKRKAQASGQPRGTKARSLPAERRDETESVNRKAARERESVEKAAKAAGAKGRTVAKFKRVKKAAPELAEEVRAGSITLEAAERTVKERAKEKKREANRALVKVVPALADDDETFDTIAIDPPWDWADEDDADQFGRARPTYATMTLEQLLELDVGARANANAHIYLWITNRSLPKGFALLEKWGFRYITALTWVKPSFGMGNYFRGSTEHVLFGVRGSLPLLRANAGTHFSAKRGAIHSTKPDAFYELVESCSPGPWLEVFSRHQRTGWKTWGAEA